MSMPRIFAALAAVSFVAVSAAALAVWLFPMQANAQSADQTMTVTAQAGDSPGIVVEAGGKLLHRHPVFYPVGESVTGTVLLEANLNSKGEVTDARVISGPSELRRAALESVLGWHYSAETGAPPTVQISIQFNQAPALRAPLPVKGSAKSAGPSGPSATIQNLQFDGMSADLARQLTQRVPVHPGDLFTSDTFARAAAAAHEIDEHIAVGLSRDASGSSVVLRFSLGPSFPAGVRGGIVGGVSGGVVQGIPGGISGGIPGGVPAGVSSGVVTIPAPPAPPPSEGVQRIRVGGMVQQVNLIRKVVPAYPALAKQARISGTVRFDAIIGTDGSVQNLQLISGHPLLVQSATEAVKQWLYKPVLLNGAPVEVITTIDVNFTLSEDN
jgi:TonB family protein